MGRVTPRHFRRWGGSMPTQEKKKKKFGSSQSSFEKLNFGNSSQETRKNRYQTFLGLSSFTDLPYYLPNVLPRIVPNINLNKEILTKYLLCLKNLYCWLKNKDPLQSMVITPKPLEEYVKNKNIYHHKLLFKKSFVFIVHT